MFNAPQQSDANEKMPPIATSGADGVEFANKFSPTQTAATSTNDSALQPDYSQSIAFLQRFHPARRWLLTAIVPDGRNETEGFDPQEADKAREWIAACNPSMNIYFHVNEVPSGFDVRAKKGNIVSVPYLHVDLDPRVGEPLAAKQQRIRALLTEKLPAGRRTPADGNREQWFGLSSVLGTPRAAIDQWQRNGSEENRTL